MSNGRSGKAPAFSWYAADWLADMHVRSMTPAARGVFADLLSLEWREGPLPNNQAALAKATSTPPADMAEVWDSVCSRFKLDRDGLLFNPRLERERKSLDSFKRQMRKRGRKGGQATAARHLKHSVSDQAPAQADAQLVLKPASASASASASANPLDNPIDLDGEPPKPAAPVGMSVERRKGKSHEDVTAHLSLMLAPERRETLARMAAEGKRRVLAELVFAYWQVKRHHQQALYDEVREGVLVRALKANRDNISELLYVVDGAGQDKWQDRKDHDGIEVLFRNRAQVERFAGFCTGYKTNKPHKTAIRYGLAEEDTDEDAHTEIA